MLMSSHYTVTLYQMLRDTGFIFRLIPPPQPYFEPFFLLLCFLAGTVKLLHFESPYYIIQTTINSKLFIHSQINPKRLNAIPSNSKPVNTYFLVPRNSNSSEFTVV